VRYGKGHKEQTRRTILEKASTRYRRDGLSAVGLRMLMTDAGLTHGGFYAHFPSRSALIAEAIGAALAETLKSLAKAVARAAPGNGVDAFIDAYLTSLHRDRPDRGCAAASLAAEIAREGAEVRKRFTKGTDAIVRLLADQLPPGGDPRDRVQRAFTVFSLLMGVLQLSRAIVDPRRSGRILASGRRAARTLALEPWR